MSILDVTIKMTEKYIQSFPKEDRKKIGQFFTSKETAVFMAELFEVSNDSTELSVLDPGAGSGILSIALLERLQSFKNLQRIKLVCYENDSNILGLLRANLENFVKQSRLKITIEIINGNYILSQAEDYNSATSNLISKKFDLVIGNPPYMKIAKAAPEAQVMSDICYGAPNLYFLFTSMSVFNLKENGQLVYILPRSWTSGAYFKKFRQKLLKDNILEHIHLFYRRDKIFEKESVLQEAIIIKVRKTNQRPKTITISSSETNADFSKKTVYEAPYAIIGNGVNSYVFLVTNTDEVNVFNRINKWKYTLPQIGLKMKTGLTVDFRNKDALRDKFENKAVPLFYPHHIQNGRVVFPIGENNKFLVTTKIGLLQPNKNYLFVKRFTTKEEYKRLQCGIYLAKNFSTFTKISTQNKLNFVDGDFYLTDNIVYGLYVLFNSRFYDCYYRILNGSTQVNSTEINQMPVPSLDIIESMGRDLLGQNNLSDNTCDHILMKYL